MPQISLDDKTFSQLQSAAKTRGLTVGEYLQSLIEQEGNGILPAFSARDFEQVLDELATDGPPLPRDFSRADVYAEHD